MDTPTTSRPYEYFAQREMNALAAQVGTLRAELKIIRCTLSAMQPYWPTDELRSHWQKDELRILIARIDDVLAEKS